MFPGISSLAGPTRESIAKKSDAALNMFRTAIAKLEQSSEEANTLMSTNQSRIDELDAENTALDQIVADNGNVISKIKNLIS